MSIILGNGIEQFFTRVHAAGSRQNQSTFRTWPWFFDLSLNWLYILPRTQLCLLRRHRLLKVGISRIALYFGAFLDLHIICWGSGHGCVCAEMCLISGNIFGGRALIEMWKIIRNTMKCAFKNLLEIGICYDVNEKCGGFTLIQMKVRKKQCAFIKIKIADSSDWPLTANDFIVHSDFGCDASCTRYASKLHISKLVFLANPNRAIEHSEI